MEATGNPEAGGGSDVPALPFMPPDINGAARAFAPGLPGRLLAPPVWGRTAPEYGYASESGIRNGSERSFAAAGAVRLL